MLASHPLLWLWEGVQRKQMLDRTPAQRVFCPCLLVLSTAELPPPIGLPLSTVYASPNSLLMDRAASLSSTIHPMNHSRLIRTHRKSLQTRWRTAVPPCVRASCDSDPAKASMLCCSKSHRLQQRL